LVGKCCHCRIKYIINLFQKPPDVKKQWFCLSLHGKPCPIEQLGTKLLNKDKYNTCALSKHIGKYVHSARNAEKRLGESSPFPQFLNLMHIFPICFQQCTSLVYLFLCMYLKTMCPDMFAICSIYN
jgi:hypothetical protein